MLEYQSEEGRTVKGRVVDEATGQSVAGVRIFVAIAAAGVIMPDGHRLHSAESDQAGHFEFRERLPTGKFHLRVEGAGEFGPSFAQAVDAGVDLDELVVRVRAKNLFFVKIDRRALGSAAEMEVARRRGLGVAVEVLGTVGDDDVLPVFLGSIESGDSIEFGVRFPEVPFYWWTRVAGLSQSSRVIELALPRPAEVRIAPRSTHVSGVAVESFALRMQLAPGGANHRRQAPRSFAHGRHPEGLSLRLFPGIYAYECLPLDDVHAPVDSVLAVKEGASLVETPLLPASSRVRVHLFDPAGNAVRDSTVEIVRLPSPNFPLQSQTPTIWSRGLKERDSPPVPVLRAIARSDAEGMALLRIARDGESCAIRILGDHLPFVVPHFRATQASEDVDVLVDRGARLVVRWSGPLGEELLRDLRVEIITKDGSDPTLTAMDARRSARFGPGSSVEIPKLIPGNVECVVRHRDVEIVELRQRIRLVEGEHSELVLDSSRVRLVTIAGRVLELGDRSGWGLGLVPEGLPIGTQAQYPVELDSQGQFSVSLLPGAYYLVAGRMADGRVHWRFTRAQLLSTQSMHVDFALQSRRLAVRILDSNGDPIVGRAVSFHCEIGGSVRAETDADGVARVADLSDSEYQVQIAGDPGSFLLLPSTDATKTHEFSLR